MGLGLVDLLQIFVQLYLIELLGLLTDLGLLELWHFIYPRLLTGFGMLVYFTNLSHRISSQIFGLISSVLSNRRLQVVLDGKFSQEYLVNAGVSQGSILGPTLFLLYLNDLPDDVICCIAIYADDTTLHSKCDQASDLWHNLIFLLNLNLIYETLWTGARIGLLISMLGKLNWFRLTSLTLVLVM